MLNDFSILIATANGSGSQSPNHILAKALFRSGVSVGAKNIFPSNIAGLPTWFAIRTNLNGFTSMQRRHQIVVAKNIDTYQDDLRKVAPHGFYFYDQEFDLKPEENRIDVTYVPIPFRELTKDLSGSIKMRKLLTNVIYLGALAELIKLDIPILEQTLGDYFQQKESVIEVNLKALHCGRKFAQEHLKDIGFHYSVSQTTSANQNHIFVDGNSAAALGALSGGCTFFSWYPITPASSLAENFNHFASISRVNEKNENLFAQVQSEDELSAVNMAIGAGWAGCRAMTSTSGPGLSLMAEGAGLSYFAEIPTVIWDVQRAGPSTGLPTRTMQGDLRFAAHLSHGDCEHVVLIPATPEECFEMGQTAFDIAEKLQTLVIVLSDLDLGMNYFVATDFEQNTRQWSRGKVLSAEDLNELEDYARYRDVDGDGIGHRTLPGTKHLKSAYFTRGTAHNEKSGYSEDSDNFKSLLDRLKKKMTMGLELLPPPVFEFRKNTEISLAVITYGSTYQIIDELRHLCREKNIIFASARIRSLPLRQELETFFEQHQKIVIIEQNRDGQMRDLLSQKFSSHAHKFTSLLQYDGLPISADIAFDQICQLTTPINRDAPHGC